MSATLDKFFGINAKALNVLSQRSELLANNIANVDTPNYKARDVDFSEILRSSVSKSNKSVSLQATHDKHFGFGEKNTIAETKYRVPLQPSLDGNTVDSQVEHGLFAENAVRYQISLQFLSNKIKGLVKTLREE